MTTRHTTMLAQVLAAEPDHTKNSRIVPEYEFSANGGGNPLTHEGGQRVFKGDYQVRGAYDPDRYPINDDALLWNGVPLVIDGVQLVWDD